MDELLNGVIENPSVRLLFTLTVLFIGSSAYYSLFNSSKKILTLFVKPHEPLTQAEQVRVDRLLESAKRFHGFSFALAGILMALSSLGDFEKFSAPFGSIIFPKLQSSLGLFLLCIVSLIISDRYFLMVYPWLAADNRRPPYDWTVMGLSFERSLFTGFLFVLPVQIGALGTGIILGSDPSTSKALTVSVLLFTGFALVYLPRTFYYWSHLIDVREDHRGGTVTLSIYLLYWYRVIRQLLYANYIFLPIMLVIPQWQNPAFISFVVYSTIVLGGMYVIRMFCSVKNIYRRIDKLGKRYGFPTTSQHYQ